MRACTHSILELGTESSAGCAVCSAQVSQHLGKLALVALSNLRPRAVQAALYAAHSQADLQLMARLTKNVVVSPTGKQLWAKDPG